MKIKIQLIAFLLFAGLQFAQAQKIGLLLDSYFIDRWYTDEKVLSERVRELGGECIIANPNGVAEEQFRMATKMMDDGIDVLVIVPVDGKKAIQIVDAAKARNIPVIAYDRFIKSKGVSFFVSYDSKMVGQLQAKYAAEHAPTGNYLLVNGPVSDNNAILFREGQLEVLKNAVASKKINIIGDFVLNDWSEMEAMAKVDEFLSTSKVLPDVIIAGNDAIATGALQSIPESSAHKMIIVGQDGDIMAIRNIIDGQQSMTVYKPIRPLATKAAEVAMQLAQKKPVHGSLKVKIDDVEVDAIQLTPIVVDKNNYKETVVKDGHVNLSK
jgi:D-xylose transport system substrate-binding protein